MFKKIMFMLLLSLISIFAFAETTEISSDLGISNLNSEWNFNKPGESVSFVSVPHTWNGEDVLDILTNDYEDDLLKQQFSDAQLKEAGDACKYYRGKGIYRKKIRFSSDIDSKQVYLRFHAVSLTAEVFIDDQLVGSHQGGYTAFAFDISNFIRKGQEQEIRVVADNGWKDDVMPRIGDFNVFGGIYRDVEVIIKNKTCITPLDSASDGVYFLRQNVSKESADITATVMIASDVAQDLMISVSLLTPEGTLFHQTEKNIIAPAHNMFKTQLSFSVKNPHLWNGIQDPFYYTAVTKLYKGEKIIDTIEEPVGFTFYHADKKKGFFLNGKPYKLNGVSRHQDKESVGVALSAADEQLDIDLMLEMGVTSLRLSHYPQSKGFIEMCDKAGIITWSEIPFVGGGGYTGVGYNDTEAFKSNGINQLKEMIKQRYNHPSIQFWGLFNELRVKPGLIDYLEKMKSVTLELDPSKKIAVASNQNNERMNNIPDYIAWNKYFGWYGSKPSVFGGWADSVQRKYSKPVGVSEYGAGGSIYHHEEKLMQPKSNNTDWHPEKWQTYFHEEHLKLINKRPYLWGVYVWNMFDFSMWIRREGDRLGVNDKGLITYDRKTKKDAFYFYKANWNPEPFTWLAEKKNLDRTNKKITIKAYSNAKQVELFLNGKSIGKKKSKECAIFLWKVKLIKGENKIRVVADNGTTDEFSWNYLAQ